MGGNFLRIAHYPQADALLDACDRLGILVWEEIPIVNEITPSPAFFETCASQLKEMIAQHRNHPSVVMWGYMNEIFLGFGKQKTDSAKALHTKETVRLARYLDTIVHKTDPNRLSTMALHNSSKYNESGIGDVANVTGWNLYHGWYHDAFPQFGSFMDKEHAAYPNRIHLISEFGAGSDQRLSTNQPNIYDFSPQYQLLYHQSYLKQIMDRPWISGGTMWNLVDFGSEGRKETMPHINNKGLFTMDRKPKDAYFLYQAFLSKKPMAHLAIGDWAGKILAEDGKIKMQVISNQEKVILFAGNQKIGEVVIKDKMGEFVTATPLSPIWIRLENEKGLMLGFQELTAVSAADVNSPNFTELAINVGSNCAFKQEKTGTIWFPSQAYKPGSWGHVGGQIFKGSRSRFGSQAYIFNSEDQPLFQTMMDSLSSYKLDVADGEYELELLFSELEPNMKPTNVLYDLSSNKNPNKTGFNRVFNIRINGQLWKENFEPAKDPGGFRAGSYKTIVQAKEGKGVSIDFEKVLGNPMLNGLKIKKL
jgi:beta-galactosidase